ncbi:helix-turn-helix domain-containing protein [Nocardia salmonicida]|uniref:helix-turn-helix domain-containing protein n=1 Tax=Nocardia salmonicida TaxID=53431 RepID=UPI0007A4DD9E|nr:helix-turn-helix transcriptional regulator [Nocardia salmonicida]MBC7299504.1 helix-turn-helix transcriptional regulator [Nocardia sp.]
MSYQNGDSGALQRDPVRTVFGGDESGDPIQLRAARRTARVAVARDNVDHHVLPAVAEIGRDSPEIDIVDVHLTRAAAQVADVAGLTQREVAQAAGLHRSFYGAVEGGKNISIDNVFRIADAWGLTSGLCSKG